MNVKMPSHRTHTKYLRLQRIVASKPIIIAYFKMCGFIEEAMEKTTEAFLTPQIFFSPIALFQSFFMKLIFCCETCFNNDSRAKRS